MNYSEGRLKSWSSAAAAGLLLMGCTETKDTAQGSDSQATVSDSTGKDKNCCIGLNECKGKGGCATESHSCAGKNECRGKGGCNMHCPK